MSDKIKLDSPKAPGKSGAPVVDSRSKEENTKQASMAGALPIGEDRRNWISNAAYLYAEQRGFAPGWELDDWLAAERDLERTKALCAKR
jgi:Protein of unknown function (DUF2934)